MASPNFIAYDRTLRRMFMMRLVESLGQERGAGFRASLVVNPRTGLPPNALRPVVELDAPFVQACAVRASAA